MSWQDLAQAAEQALGRPLAEHSLAPQQSLFKQGEPSSSLYLVLSGELEAHVQKRGEEHSVPVGRIFAGELVGEIGWALGTRRSASVVAATPATLLEVPAEVFPKLREAQHPSLGRVAALLDQRLRSSRLSTASQPVDDALTGWLERRRSDNQDIDVVLLTHARSTQDLSLALPWLDGLADAELVELSRWLRPVFGEVLQADPSSIGLLFLPRLAADLMDPRRRAEVRRMVAQECMALARTNGAKVMCLGGLTASLMKYGRLLDDAPEAEGVTVTSGHAVTAVCCVRTFLAGLQRAELEPEAEQLTIVGAGSVGAAFLELLLAKGRAPRRILLTDLPGQRQRLEAIITRLTPNLPKGVVLEAAPTTEAGRLPPGHPAYDSRMLFSATSAADVIDIQQVLPGTVLVDDSQPHCWSRELGWERVQRRGDIFPCEAGLVDCSALSYHSYFPFDYVEQLSAGTQHAWCCLTEGLLLARDPSLRPTRGEPDLASVLSFDQSFEQAGLRPAPLRCGPHLL